MPLSEQKIRKLRVTEKTQILRDSPGLFLQVWDGDTGAPVRAASWVVRVTRGGKTRKTTVGRWPDMPVERARCERDRLTGVNTDVGVTVQEQVDEYRRLVTDKHKSGDQTEVYLRHFIATHGHRKIATVTRTDLVSMVKAYARDRGERSADRYLSQLRGIFTTAVEDGVIDQSPLLGVTKRITGYTKTNPQRILSDAEIRQLFEWDHVNAALLRFLLLTGLRISEDQKGHRDGDRWIVPAKISKNGREHCGASDTDGRGAVGRTLRSQ